MLGTCGRPSPCQRLNSSSGSQFITGVGWHREERRGDCRIVISVLCATKLWKQWIILWLGVPMHGRFGQGCALLATCRNQLCTRKRWSPSDYVSGNCHQKIYAEALMPFFLLVSWLLWKEHNRCVFDRFATMPAWLLPAFSHSRAASRGLFFVKRLLPF